MRLIDADTLYETLRTDEDIAMEKVFDTPISLPDGALNPSYISFMTQASVLTSFKNMVYDAPTVDAVEVIRCKDCKHRILNKHYGEIGHLQIKAYCELDTGDPFDVGRDSGNDNWFCADAERR